MPTREEIARINTHERILADLDEWETALEDIRRLISQGEISMDGDEFTDARRKIKSVLAEIQNTRQFLHIKQEVAANVPYPLENVEEGATVLFDL